MVSDLFGAFLMIQIERDFARSTLFNLSGFNLRGLSVNWWQQADCFAAVPSIIHIRAIPAHLLVQKLLGW